MLRSGSHSVSLNGLSAQQIANLHLNEDGMAPMRLNFSSEALGESHEDIG